MRRLLLVFVLGAAVAVAAYTLLSDEDEPVAGGTATLVGDSLMVGVEPYVDDHLPGWSLAFDAQDGRTTAEGLDVLRALRKSLGQGLAVSLGTNDDPGAVDAFRSKVREALEIAGPRRCVVWVNVSRPPFNGVSSAGLNRVLEDEASSHPKLRIVDWASLVGAHPEWMGPDQVHATEAGYDGRAAAIAAELERCRP